MLRFLLIVCFGLLSTVVSAAPELPPTLSEAEEQSALRVSELAGALVFVHDRAAAVATDALRHVRGFRRNKKLDGWVTEAQGGEVHVTFTGRDRDEPVALYRVRVNGAGSVVGKPQVLKEPGPLSAFEIAAVAARSIAQREAFAPCAEKYNTVVFPSEEGLEQWSVYLLPAATTRDVVPIGGSYRVDVDMRTETAAVRPYTKSCIQLQNDPKAVGLMVTHLLDPVPTDVHVFWSLWAGKSLYVGTPPNGTLWAIEGERIRLVQRR